MYYKSLVQRNYLAFIRVLSPCEHPLLHISLNTFYTHFNGLMFYRKFKRVRVNLGDFQIDITAVDCSLRFK